MARQPSSRPIGLGSMGQDLAAWLDRKDAPWGSPVNLGAAINTAFNERSPELSRDGHFLFFATNRPGGRGTSTFGSRGGRTSTTTSAGGRDQSERRGERCLRRFRYGLLENDEIGIPSSTLRRTPTGRLGSADIYRTRCGGTAASGRPCRCPTSNSPQGDFRPSLRADGLEIVFDSNHQQPDVAGIGLAEHLGVEAPCDVGAVVGPDQPGSSGRTARSTTTSRCCRATAPRW